MQERGFYHRRIRPWVNVLIVALVLVGAVVGLRQLIFGPKGDYIVKAEYADAGGVVVGSSVKVAGVPAGKVRSIDLTNRDTALVTMGIDKGAAPIGAGAKAITRPVNLLGEKYVDLEPGDSNKPLPSGSMIPESRTGAPVELDDILNTLDDPTRARLRILINEAGIGLEGRGANFNALLGELPSSLDKIRALVSEIAAQNDSITSAIHQGRQVVAAVDGHRDDLQDLVTSAAHALDVTASRRADLGSTVDRAPAALGQLTHTLGTLRSASDTLQPAAVALRQATPSLADALRRLPAFEQAAKPTLAEVVRTAPSLAKLGREGSPTVARLRRTGNTLADFAKLLAPVSESVAHGGIQGILGLMNGWSRTIRQADGLGHVFRIQALVNVDTIRSALSTYSNLLHPESQTRRHAAHRPAHTAPSQGSAPGSTGGGSAPAGPVKKAVDNVAGALQNTLGGVGNAAKGVLGGAGRAVDGAVKGVGGAVQHLLGGQKPGGSDERNSGNVLQLFDYLFAP